MNEVKIHPITPVKKISGFGRRSDIAFFTSFLAVTAVVMFEKNTAGDLPQFSALILAGIAGWTDLRKRVIPNTLILAGLAAAILLNISGQLMWSGSLASGAGALLAVLAIRGFGSQLYGKPGFGMGDVKLFMILGMLLGAEIFWILYVSVMLAGIFSVGGIALGYLYRDGSLAFAPFIVCAVLIDFYWISWNEIWRWLVW